MSRPTSNCNGLKSSKINIRELLRDEMQYQDTKNNDRPHLSVERITHDSYILLDSFHKLRVSNLKKGEFKWNFAIQGDTGDEVIGIHSKLDDVVSIQIGSFSMDIPAEVNYETKDLSIIPNTNRLVLVSNNNNSPNAPTAIPNLNGYGQYPQFLLVPPKTTLSPWISNPYTQIPYANRITLQIREAGLQAFRGRDGTRHHFDMILSPDANTNLLVANPLSITWDTYNFTTPLQDLHGITMIFRNPDKPLLFAPDCLYDIPINVDNNVASPGPYIRFNSLEHQLNMGDRIHLTDFKSGNTILDSYLNRADGHVVAGDPVLPALEPGHPIPGDFFWTDPAISIIDLTHQPPQLPRLATVYIAKRRIRIPLHIRRSIPRISAHA